MLTEVAFEEVQLSVEESPLPIDAGFAFKVTVGAAAGGGGGAGAGGAAFGGFLQPRGITAAARAMTNRKR
jgi:hypothetical protein